jgi:hypothetical protein
VADVLRGQIGLDGANPVEYASEPTLTERTELATVGYVLDTSFGGDLAFDQQVVTGVLAGETVAEGDLLYFDTSTQRWRKTDATDATTVQNVQLGIALGAGSDGVAVTGGVLLSGTFTTTGLTAGATYFASNTNGEISDTAGNIEAPIGIALSTTRLLFTPRKATDVVAIDESTRDSDTPANDEGKLVKLEDDGKISGQFLRTFKRTVFTTNGTFTPDAQTRYLEVEVQAGGGGGAGGAQAHSGGAAGGYAKKMLNIADVLPDQSIVVGSGGNGGSSAGANGGNGGNSTVGSLITTNGGQGGQGTSNGATGGTATGGDLNVQGGDGERGLIIGTGTRISGSGGSSPIGDGGKSESYGSSTGGGVVGTPGRGFGSGGGGACAGSGSATGGAGRPGIVIITEYF